MVSKVIQYTTIVFISTVAISSIAYAAWWDSKRRNDPAFRKKIRKEHKRIHKHAKAAEERAKQQQTEDLKEALEMIKVEPVPPTAEEREQYFMQHVGVGEQLSVQGPAFYVPAALSFYRALRVYPSPVELIMIYQKTVPEPIFKIVMDLTSMDTRERAEGYYHYFPPPYMNVEVKQILQLGEPGESEKGPRRIVLVATKDLQPGEEIYKEHPVVAQLDMDLEGTSRYCSHCFKEILPFQSLSPVHDLLLSTYCSGECEMLASTQSQNLLFGRGPRVPDGVALDQKERSEEAEIERRAYQQAFADFLKASNWTQVLLVARFCARQVAEEVKKLEPQPLSLLERSRLPEPAAGSPNYTFFDHVERLKYLDIKPIEMVMLENHLLKDVLSKAVDGLEELVSLDKYLMMKGKMAYNAIGVAFAGGRDDKPEPKGHIETWEWSRTPYGTNRQIGSALYRVSSNLTHSCSPSVRPTFPTGTNELHLVANRAISKGEELTMAYTYTHADGDESEEDARRRRRTRLARGWRFACECETCAGKKEGLPGVATLPQPILEHAI
ncbi:MAS20-domain-containing protein [Calocera cornea HHB12733]|uniref:MAS20-domain-containing protein n=1 Tax=Calocera cornea HHB12733 TaxID=1353952 RepID=A0A165JNX0_9BASI|nr:MAS20-domain-containing protein [Calocera cornea HHB12733]